MNYGCCLSCEHCDPDRKNNLGEVRCKRFSTFVEPSSWCDYHSDKYIQELVEKLKRSNNNE